MNYTDSLGNEYQAEVIVRLIPLSKGLDGANPLEILLSMNPDFALHFRTQRLEPIMTKEEK